ncbi:uncharacterized protein LOC109536886 [Dendroctonus ponderosae]|uniref:CHK kinase-like domain-containing protein n=1 Tax=Dendroctonus ponderosae TaxID=77166 RepID=U4UEK6_DENPD|nr:uncharacterized protein LOC109536886 [Dendroctonus ponderosae]ERL88330.1 hypothetical protein D910_05717 [Dendroctonus ponderosae]KAH1015308.1 hypothetical protein HUJ05_013062 [Dendroctonus ponderosae]
MAAENEFTTEDLLTDLFKCVSVEALKNENIQKYDLKIYGSEDKIEQYGSDIAFIDISAENFEAEKRMYNLVLKYGHTQKNIKSKVPIREGFEREIEVYSKLVPCYQRFQQQKNLSPLAIVPKCFLTKFSNNDEIIVLENLKIMGYHTHNRKRAMDVNHIKLILEAYAQWHSLSFALYDQKDDEFLEIKSHFLSNPWKNYFPNQLGEMIDIGQNALYTILEENDEMELLQKFQQKICNANARTALMDLMEINENAAVILHGDCWNNNFLFKYRDGDLKSNICIEVQLLDFQMASWRSPVFDLSLLLYCVASETELDRFKELLDHYYFHLSHNIKKLGSNPEKIFPFRTLKNHWNKYSVYGAILSPFIAMYSFIDKEDTADFGVCQTLKKTTLKPEYMERVIAVARHFVECDL